MKPSIGPNPWHGLLFLHGHIADAELARALAGAPAAPRPTARGAWGVLARLLDLSRRPTLADRNLDRERAIDSGREDGMGAVATPRPPQRATC